MAPKSQHPDEWEPYRRTQRCVVRDASEFAARVAHVGRDHVAARSATSDDAAELGVEPGTVILPGENWYFDASGSAIEYGEYLTAGDRGWSYDYLAST